MPSLPHRPALAPRDGISSFVSVQSSDSYYSNEEIAILHDVVAAAQDNLDLLPEGERLATNALFQAYDTVLPNYGIDPEEDHHISRLVFRVGGERGDGSLLDKLRSVLERMGIELEFDSRSESSRRLSYQEDARNDDAVSQPSSLRSIAGQGSAVSESENSQYIQSHQQDVLKSRSVSAESGYLDHHSSNSKLTYAASGLRHLDHRPVGPLEHPPPSHSPSTAGITEQSRQSPRSGAGSHEQHRTNDTTVQPAGPPAVLHSEKNRIIASLPSVESRPVRTVNWLLPDDANAEHFPKGHNAPLTEHKTQNQQSQQDQQQLANKIQHSSDEKTVDDSVNGHKQGVSTNEQQNVENHRRSDANVGEPFMHNELQQLQPPISAEQHPSKSVESDPQNVPDGEEPEGNAAMEAQYSVLKRRAAKASRYLQLLRGISHWKQYAIERLERTAVARRHILRMRHFDPWELVTADTKLKGRRIFALRIVTLWLKRTDNVMVDGHRALVNTQHRLTNSALAAWFTSCPAYTETLNQPRFLAAQIRRWQLSSSVSQALCTHANEFGKRFFISRVCGSWQQHVLAHHRDIDTFRRLRVVQDSLNQWQLETKVELFKARMGFRLIRDALSRWHSTCRFPPSCGPPIRHGHRRCINDAVDQTRAHLTISIVSPLIISQKMLRTKVLDTWQRQASASARASTRSRRFAAHQGALKAVNSWYLGVHQKQSLSTWAQRGFFYVQVTGALSTWRSKGVWRSSTRKAYARCRQHVKTAFTKGYLNQWKASSQLYSTMDWQAAKRYNIMKQHRLVFVLDVWRDESNNDRGASRLLTAAWLGEWQGMSHELAGIHGRAKEAWKENLKSRYWGQWQSTLLRLKSREYVASDVKERNKKKLVRRLLLYWKGDGDLSGSQQTNIMRASLGKSRRDLGLGANLNSLQLSRAVYEQSGATSFRDSRLEEFGPTVEEDDQDGVGSGADVDGIIVNTPTRWTGMASSVRLPSMTPFAPLPTPFERELRERYNKSMPLAPSGQLSRLSFAQAQRLSAAETNTRLTKTKAKTDTGSWVEGNNKALATDERV